MASNGKTSGPVGRERRAHQRYPVNLIAKLRRQDDSDAQVRRCVVRDFCVGGMYLAVEQRAGETNGQPAAPGKGESVVLECLAPATGGDHGVLRFRAQVVRRQGDGLAIRFQDPDLEALKTLLDYARSLSGKRSTAAGDAKPAPLSGESFAGSSAAEIIQHCNQLAIRTAANVVAGFHEEALDYLVEVAKVALDISEQNAYFDALKVLNSSRDSLRKQFLAGVEEHLKHYSPSLPIFESGSENQAPAGSLSIVDDEVFDDWLADTATVDSVESRNREVLTEIERRLSLLYDAEVKRVNNPYGPPLFTRMFHEALKPLDLRHKVNLACYKVFRNVLLENLDGLYSRINQYFIDHGVMPVIQYSTPAAVADPEQHGERETEPEEATGVDDADAEHAEQDALASGLDTEGDDTGAGTEGVGNRPAGAGSVRDAGQDLYQLVGELRTLQRQLTRHLGEDRAVEPVPGEGRGELMPRDGGTPEPPSVQSYSRREVQAALDMLAPTLGTGATGVRDFKTEILRVLGRGDGDDGKSIGTREARIIDVASNIFHWISEDIQVSDKIRNWIEQLEVPVIKIAVEDDTLFTDRNHLVRQMINKVAKLEMLVGESEKADQPAVKKALDWIVGLVNNEFDGSTEVFARAVHQLDLLLKVQDRAYNANLQRLVDQSREEESTLLASGDAALAEPELAWGDASEDEKALWIKRADRLEEGDWVVMDVDSDSSRRLRIAWKAPHTRRVVFANVLGVKDLVLHLYELAEKLRAGSVVVLDNVDEPAMDRAQYSMLEDLHKQLLYQSTHDQLTGLVSRREFEKHLGEALSLAKENQSRHAVCFLDLDQFSLINNACGYEGGDRLLKEIAQLLVREVGGNGTLARLGSDEFGLLLKNVALDDALDVVEELMETVQDYRLQWQGKRLSVGVSVGLVPVSRRSDAASELLQAAESSCSVAKEMGGNRIQLYSSGHAGLSRRRKAMKWAVEIDRILDEDTLYLRCQRIKPINEANGAKSHYEILLGVWDLNGGDISTPEFIEAAERYKRMPDVDRWVIRNAFRWINDHHESLADSVDMFSINLSGRSMNDESFLGFLLEHIRESAVPVEKITFEVTETAGVANLTDAGGFIESVKETGCLFALDDFGTGMSSYAYLKNLPVDYLKIDGAFVKDMANTPSDYAVVKSICEIGHFMGKKVIAEFVENDEILAMLRELGVDYAQGYGIEKPCRLSDLV